jgi:hypothetical protein
MGAARFLRFPVRPTPGTRGLACRPAAVQHRTCKNGGRMLRNLDRRDTCIAPMVVVTLGTPPGIPVTAGSWRALTLLVLQPKQWVH